MGHPLMANGGDYEEDAIEYVFEEARDSSGALLTRTTKTKKGVVAFVEVFARRDLLTERQIFDPLTGILWGTVYFEYLKGKSPTTIKLEDAHGNLVFAEERGLTAEISPVFKSPRPFRG